MRFIENIPRLIKRIIGFGIIILLLLFVILGVINYFNKPQKPPDSTEAPWLIQTSSRIYLGKEMTMDGTSPILRGYWTLEGNRYVFHDKVIEFSHEVFGDVKIVERK